MIYGILKDRKAGENRVISTPAEVKSIVNAGHEVWAEADCGRAAGFPDEKYAEAGARIVADRKEIWKGADMVAKVKEFTPDEYPLMREGQILLGCLHPALHSEEVDALLKSRAVAFTAEDMHEGTSPNCEAAGKQGALFALESMLTTNGGKGLYVGGLAGARRARVLILGAGNVGCAALEVLQALGADCTVMDIDRERLRLLLSQYHSQIDTVLCSKDAIAARLPQTDIVINCVKWDKARKDFLIDREMLKQMERGSVLVDISNDDPGAIESSRPTRHDAPRYIEEGVVHYCVDNIPGAVAHSASVAYGGAMLPKILRILNEGVRTACVTDGFLRRSLTAFFGYLTHEETSAVQGRAWIPPEKILSLQNESLAPAPPASRARSQHFYPQPFSAEQFTQKEN